MFTDCMVVHFFCATLYSDFGVGYVRLFTYLLHVVW